MASRLKSSRYRRLLGDSSAAIGVCISLIEGSFQGYYSTPGRYPSILGYRTTESSRRDNQRANLSEVGFYGSMTKELPLGFLLVLRGLMPEGLFLLSHIDNGLC